MVFYPIIKHETFSLSKLLQIIETESSPKHIKSSNQKQYIQISLWCLLSYILEHVVSLEINETHSS